MMPRLLSMDRPFSTLLRIVILLSASMGCTEQTVTPGAPVPASSLCAYPRACFLRDCDDCQGGPNRCRRVLGGCGADMGPLSGCLAAPQPTDPAIACGADADGGAILVCALPEAICVARGPRCDGYCVRAAERCDSGTPIPPQHGGADGGGPYCPYSDDVCCPATRDLSASDQAAPTDGALSDGPPRG